MELLLKYSKTNTGYFITMGVAFFSSLFFCAESGLCFIKKHKVLFLRQENTAKPWNEVA